MAPFDAKKIAICVWAATAKGAAAAMPADVSQKRVRILGDLSAGGGVGQIVSKIQGTGSEIAGAKKRGGRWIRDRLVAIPLIASGRSDCSQG